MNKRIKLLIDKLKELFWLEAINKLALKTKFVQRKSKLSSKEFLSLCVFSGEDLCTSNLITLCSRLLRTEGISISAEGLNKRFNSNSVEFMQAIFYEMLIKQNEILKQPFLKSHFHRIKITDSTSFILPKEFKEHYKGTKGSSADSSVKIQLEFDLLSGQFLNCEVMDGLKSDANFIPVLQRDIRENDLCLKDLGYFKVDDLKYIDESQAFFISKLKSSSIVYTKNPDPKKFKNGKVIKSSEFKKVDIEQLVKPLAEGQTIELSDIYSGKNKNFKTRLIVTKLTEENKRKKEFKVKEAVRKKVAKFNEKAQLWLNINAYITNIPIETVSAEDIHNIYSLRWQIEIMFKIWKSLFKIHLVKKVKLQRFQCFLYGRLIALLISSSLVFTAKEVIYEETKKEISEIKSFSIVKEFFINIKEKIFKGYISLIELFDTIVSSILRYGIKSKRKDKKTPLLILEGIQIDNADLTKLVV